MKQFTVPMALVDFIPVILFLLAVLIVYKDLKGRISSLSLSLFTGGTAMVTAAGFLKALYKLLYALNVGDFAWMSGQFFANQAFGFLLAGVGLMLAVRSQGQPYAYAIVPTMALVGIMVLGLGAMDAALCFMASKLKDRKGLILIVVSFFLSLMMGYLSSRNFDQAYMNWMAEGINLAGQLCLYLGCVSLHNSGLAKYSA